MERPVKRRRVSPPGEDDDVPDTASQGSSSPSTEHVESDQEEEQPRPNFDINTISRIKAKSKPTPRNGAPPNLPQPTVPASILASTDLTSNATFSTLGVDTWLTSSLAHMAIHNPTRIQHACIPEILHGRDCIGGSRTGSGKTVAFAVPILQQWAREPSGVFAVIITPTRELALQIHEQIAALGSGQGLRCVLVTGGEDMRAQALELSRRPHLVVATPGRLADLVENAGEDAVAGLRRVQFVVLDEADRLLAGGKGSMLDDLETCLSVFPAPAQRQTLLFTATVTPEVRALKDSSRTDLDTDTPNRPPIFICDLSTNTPLTVPPTLTQTYLLVNVVHKEKYLHILLLTAANVSTPTIVFCNRATTATLLEHTLRLLGHRVTALHAGLPHDTRRANLARFRARAARILLATDLAARGLDIPHVGLVVNYDLPRNPDDYIHRVGRTARAGRQGTSVSLVGQRDVELVRAIEGRVGAEMVEYREEGVSVEGRVVREALGVVGEKKREAMLDIEEGRDVRGKRRRGWGGVKKKK